MISRFVQLFVLAAFVVCTVSPGNAQTVSKSFIMKESKKQGWLGVELQDVTKRLKDKKDLTVSSGAYVTNVVDESPAEEAGIKDGDVIVKYDGKEIGDSDDLTKAVRKTKPGTEVKIEVVRKSDHKTLTATIERVKAPQAFSFNFDDHVTPHIPRAPMKMHFFSSNEMYGLTIQSLTKQLGEYFEAPGGKGVLISEVEKGSTAEKSGFKAGDVISKVNKNTIRDVDDLHEELSDNEGKEAPFEVIRKGKAVTVSMQIEEENGEEEDDDWSYNTTTPDDCPQVKTFRFDIPRIDRSEMNHFKEDMRNFKKQLKEKLRDLKETIRESLERS